MSQNISDSHLSENLVFESVDNKNSAILGRMKGEFFFPDGISRNNRWYSRKLWENALNSDVVKKKLENRLMLGTISHDTEYSDTSLQEGKFSHIITKLYIDENGRGIGEADILDTPAGRVLHTMLKAGVKLSVSSRADGDFMGEHNGIPAVNEDTYSLESFDVVLEPGFLNAKPQLVESLQEEFKILNWKINEDSAADNVDKHYIHSENNPLHNYTDKDKEYNKRKKSIKDNSNIDASIQKNNESYNIGDLNMNTELQELLGKASAENMKLTEAFNKSEVERKVLEEKLREANETISSLNKSLKLKEDMELEVNDEIKDYKEMGSVEDIKKELEKVEDIIDALATVEIIDDKEKAKEDDSYVAECLSDVYKALKIAEKYVNTTSLSGIRKLKHSENLLRELSKGLGAPIKSIKDVNEIVEALKVSEKYLNTNESIKMANTISKMAKELGVSNEAIKKVYPSSLKTTKEVYEYFGSLKTNNDKFRINRNSKIGEGLSQGLKNQLANDQQSRIVEKYKNQYKELYK